MFPLSTLWLLESVRVKRGSCPVFLEPLGGWPKWQCWWINWWKSENPINVYQAGSFAWWWLIRRPSWEWESRGVEGLKPYSLDPWLSQWGIRDWLIYATGCKQNLNVTLTWWIWTYWILKLYRRGKLCKFSVIQVMASTKQMFYIDGVLLQFGKELLCFWMFYVIYSMCIFMFNYWYPW